MVLWKILAFPKFTNNHKCYLRVDSKQKLKSAWVATPSRKGNGLEAFLGWASLGNWADARKSGIQVYLLLWLGQSHQGKWADTKSSRIPGYLLLRLGFVYRGKFAQVS